MRFLPVMLRVLIPDYGRYRAGEHGGFGRGFGRLSGAIDGRPVFGVVRATGTPVHSYRQGVFCLLLLLLLHVDLCHFRGKHFPGFFEVGIVPRISPRPKQPVSRRFIHVQILYKLTCLQTQILVFIHFEKLFAVGVLTK